MLCCRSAPTSFIEKEKTLRHADTDEIRGFFARQMFIASQSSDPRLERTFELVPREAFLPPGPWKIQIEAGYIDTPSADPVYIYQNVLVALDAGKGINNGEPLLHARWIGAVAPGPGETVTHIGAGTGFYTAILSMLVRPGGRVIGFEVEADLANAAMRNLEVFENATIVAGNAAAFELSPSDVIYVNAGVAAPPERWLTALRPGGRLIFPWRPSPTIGIAVVVQRMASGFALRPLMPAYFIACVGAADVGDNPLIPDHNSAWRCRSVHLRRNQVPDESVIANYQHVWFSSTPVED